VIGALIFLFASLRLSKFGREEREGKKEGRKEGRKEDETR